MEVLFSVVEFMVGFEFSGEKGVIAGEIDEILKFGCFEHFR